MSAYDAYLASEVDRYMNEAPTPDEDDFEDARAELGPDATEEEVEARAEQILAKRIEDSRRDAEDHAAESRLDDMNRDYY